MNKEKVVVSRQWNNPTIRAYMNLQEVGAEVSLDEFVSALLTIVGSPTMVMTRAQLAAKVTAAKDQIVDELKRATVHV